MPETRFVSVLAAQGILPTSRLRHPASQGLLRLELSFLALAANPVALGRRCHHRCADGPPLQPLRTYWLECNRFARSRTPTIALLDHDRRTQVDRHALLMRLQNDPPGTRQHPFNLLFAVHTLPRPIGYLAVIASMRLSLSLYMDHRFALDAKVSCDAVRARLAGNGSLLHRFSGADFLRRRHRSIPLTIGCAARRPGKRRHITGFAFLEVLYARMKGAARFQRSETLPLPVDLRG